MRILATYIAAATQIHSGKCYLVGMTSDYDCQAHDIESGGTAGTGNQKMQLRADGEIPSVILPKPGVECSNGLYVNAEGRCTVYWSLG